MSTKAKTKGVQESDTEELTRGICKKVNTLDPNIDIITQLEELWKETENSRPRPSSIRNASRYVIQKEIRKRNNASRERNYRRERLNQAPMT